MAEIEFDQRVRKESASQTGSLQGYINIAGAVTSLTLIIGVGIWGYKLVRRDAAGVPVIQALKGPMRIAPEDPGGQVARNIGLAVNAVAADKPLPPPPSRVVLAPASVGLSPADEAPEAITGTQTGPVGDPQTITKQNANGAGTEAVQNANLQPAAQGAAAQGGSGASAAAPGDAASTPADQPAPQDQAQPAPKDPVEAALLAARAATEQLAGEGAQAVTGGTAQAVTTSIRPMLRPSGVTVPIDQPPVVPKAQVIDPATLKPGTRLVQLGAYPSPEAAKAAWTKIVEQFGPLMDNHGQVIQKAESGGRVFYRLRAAGFGAESDSRAFCAALQAQNAGCIPVTLR